MCGMQEAKEERGDIMPLHAELPMLHMLWCISRPPLLQTWLPAQTPCCSSSLRSAVPLCTTSSCHSHSECCADLFCCAVQLVQALLDAQ